MSSISRRVRGRREREQQGACERVGRERPAVEGALRREVGDEGTLAAGGARAGGCFGGGRGGGLAAVAGAEPRRQGGGFYGPEDVADCPDAEVEGHRGAERFVAGPGRQPD